MKLLKNVSDWRRLTKKLECHQHIGGGGGGPGGGGGGGRGTGTGQALWALGYLILKFLSFWLHLGFYYAFLFGISFGLFFFVFPFYFYLFEFFCFSRPRHVSGTMKYCDDIAIRLFLLIGSRLTPTSPSTVFIYFFFLLWFYLFYSFDLVWIHSGSICFTLVSKRADNKRLRTHKHTHAHKKWLI